MQGSRKITLTVLVIIGLLLLTASQSLANKKTRKPAERLPTRAEAKEAERRLSEMGYWTGPVDGTIDGITRTALIATRSRLLATHPHHGPGTQVINTRRLMSIGRCCR